MIIQRQIFLALVLRREYRRKSMVLINGFEGCSQGHIAACPDECLVELHVKFQEFRQVIDSLGHAVDKLGQLAKLLAGDASTSPLDGWQLDSFAGIDNVSQVNSSKVRRQNFVRQFRAGYALDIDSGVRFDGQHAKLGEVRQGLAKGASADTDAMAEVSLSWQPMAWPVGSGCNQGDNFTRNRIVQTLSIHG